MKIIIKAIVISVLVIALGSCSYFAPKPTQTPKPTSTNTPTSTSAPKPTYTSVPPSETPSETLMPISTISETTLNIEATLESYSYICDDYETDSSRYAEISPDGKWVSISCGYKINQTLIVRNQSDKNWVFDFTDFIDPSLEGGMGSFTPLSWGTDNRFLYFTKVLGWSGGGNQCFPGGGFFGLYRLHLSTGTLITIIPSNDWPPGEKIRFSPTDEYFAIANDGVKITNLSSGEVTKIDVSGVMEMSWSPDGKFLAFSVASCGENFVESSSIYVWNSTTNQTQELFSTKEMLLRPQSWVTNSNLRFEGEKWVGANNEYTILEYNLSENELVFSGTATPYP